MAQESWTPLLDSWTVGHLPSYGLFGPPHGAPFAGNETHTVSNLAERVALTLSCEAVASEELKRPWRSQRVCST